MAAALAAPASVCFLSRSLWFRPLTSDSNQIRPPSLSSKAAGGWWWWGGLSVNTEGLFIIYVTETVTRETEGLCWGPGSGGLEYQASQHTLVRRTAALPGRRRARDDGAEVADHREGSPFQR